MDAEKLFNFCEGLFWIFIGLLFMYKAIWPGRLSIRFYLAGALAFVLFANFSSFAQKDDTLYFLNGDRISGEIKQYKYGFLTYKTYGVSTVKVKYEKISTFYSKKNFDILFKDGRRRFGSFDTSYMAQLPQV